MSREVSWLVLKFGGSSVSTRENWQQIQKIVDERIEQGYSVCIVHSAVKGISNLLQELTAATGQRQAISIIQKIKERHNHLADDLQLDADELLTDYYTQLQKLADDILLVGQASYGVQARILALGELMATTLGAAYLNQQQMDVEWQNARELLKAVHQNNVSEKTAILNAECNFDADTALQHRLSVLKPVVVTQGFIAGDSTHNTVLLGRGGSDVSAAYLAAKLEAERLEIWSDVPGLFSANPYEIPSARLLKNLTYKEAQEIATNGANALHPGCILPAQKHNIPIHLHCTQRPELGGTVISSEAPEEQGSVKTIAMRRDIILVSMESLVMWQKVGFLADAFEVFKSFGLSIDLISTSESNVTVSLDPVLNNHFTEVQSSFVEALEQHCKVQIIESVSAVSLLGRHIRTILHQLGGFFEVFREHRIYMVNQAANDLNFTFVVDTDQADRLVRELHEKLISQSAGWNTLGASWEELMESDSSSTRTEPLWWEIKRDELLKIAGKKGSAYVYDREEIRRNIQKMKSIKAITSFFYAMKANANAQVLGEFYDAGLGFECVSIGEMERILELFPEIDRDRILFTPNFAPRFEYERGFELGVHVTVDNIFPLQQWPHLFENKTFFLRIDPGHGRGHHHHVKTGGDHSKFGIPRFEMDQVKKIIDAIGANIKGLHAHTGSGIKDSALWRETADILHHTARELGGVKILDLGGGFGIQEFETHSSLDLKKINELLNEFKENHPQYELWIEPGRFLTATAGVLLSTVTQLKGKGKVRYVGIATGMNSLIRPALYGASHTIVNLSKLGKPASQTVNIVGPICESGDKLGIDRRFPASQEGDVVLIANAGAYGHVMSSNYNLRAPAEEIVI